MSVGVGLLYTIVHNSIEISILEDNNLDRNSFVKEEKKIFDFIIGYLDTYNIYPSSQTVEAETGERFGGFPDEPVEYWITEVRSRNDALLIINSESAALAALRDGKIEDARNIIISTYEAITRDQISKSITNLKELSAKIIELHNARQMSAELSGISFGFEYLDRMSDGAQAGDLIAIVGRPSVGKTYILLKMILEAYATGHLPLVVSMEMSEIQCGRRLLALYTCVSNSAIRFGRLSHWGKQKLLCGIDRLPSDFLFPIIQGAMNMTVESIGDKIKEIQPSAVYIDGAYLLKTRKFTKSTWERIAEVTEALKKCAGKYEIPVFASYQFNRKGAGRLENVGGSDVIPQIASIVISIDDEKAMSALAPKGKFYKTLDLIKGREGERGKIIILYDMLQMLIQQYSIISDYSTRSEP